jgi:hypothetical protein
MNDNRAPRETHQQLDNTGKHKKPYQKLSCGKVGITQGQCQAGAQKTS